MKNLSFLLLATFASTSALAGEVGATYPQLANSSAEVAVAIAETGASRAPAYDMELNVAASTQYSPLEHYIENAYQELMLDIQNRIQDRVPYLDTVLAYR